MAIVFTYKIIACGLPYTSTGTSHANAVNNFISKPHTVAGYREGNYDCDDGEVLIVIGPTQDHQLTHETQTFVMRAETYLRPMTMEELGRESAQPVIRREVERMQDEHGTIRLMVSRERQWPIRDVLTGKPGSIDDEGVWMSGKLIPWCDITGAEPAKTEAATC